MAAQLNLNTEKIKKIKTQVQNINDTANAQATTISEIMELLEGKAQGGGGAALETVVITFENKYTSPDASVYYTDANQQAQQANIINGLTITALKNTVLALYDFEYTDITGVTLMCNNGMIQIVKVTG